MAETWEDERHVRLMCHASKLSPSSLLEVHSSDPLQTQQAGSGGHYLFPQKEQLCGHV